MGVGIGVLENKRLKEWTEDLNLDPQKPISRKHWEYILAYAKSGFVIMNWQAKTENVKCQQHLSSIFSSLLVILALARHPSPLLLLSILPWNTQG